jgi:hypothetical protein
MKKFLLLLSLGLISQTPSFTQCNEDDITRVMLIGDSWANFMGIDNSINNAFEKWGHSNYKFFTNAILAENGTETSDFLTPTKLNEIQNQFTLNPDIDFVHLSLGGNDVLNTWDINFTQAQTDSLLDSVYARLITLIDFIKTAKPGVKILWSGYAYPNFGEIIEELAPFQSTHPFYATWQGMAFPTFTELNGILNDYSNTMLALAANDPQVDFIKATGLMQYTFGQTTALSVPPGGTYAPFTVPLPEGLPDYPSPKNSMRNYILFRDCFHLSPQGYNDFIDYHTQKFYQKALMDDQYFLSDGGTRDGSVSSSGAVSPQIQMGKSGNDDVSAVLSFSTTSLPDTGIAKAALFLRRESLIGANPVGSNLQLKIVSGNFSGSVDVEASDFTDPGNGTAVPCQFGSSANTGHRIRLEIPVPLLPFITNDTITQFMISAPGATGLITFTGAADPDFAPLLNVTYGPAQVSVPEIAHDDNSVLLFPNPANKVVNIGTSGLQILGVELYDLTGRKTGDYPAWTHFIDLSGYPSGIFTVKVITWEGAVVKRVVKN